MLNSYSAHAGKQFVLARYIMELIVLHDYMTKSEASAITQTLKDK